MFGGLEDVPVNPTVDPPPYACFNCWQRGHKLLKCPRPKLRRYCHNCGRQGVDLRSCPRCGLAHAKYLEEQFGVSGQPSGSRPEPPQRTRPSQEENRELRMAQEEAQRVLREEEMKREEERRQEELRQREEQIREERARAELEAARIRRQVAEEETRQAARAAEEHWARVRAQLAAQQAKAREAAHRAALYKEANSLVEEEIRLRQEAYQRNLALKAWLSGLPPLEEVTPRAGKRLSTEAQPGAREQAKRVCRPLQLVQLRSEPRERREETAISLPTARTGGGRERAQRENRPPSAREQVLRRFGESRGDGEQKDRR